MFNVVHLLDPHHACFLSCFILFWPPGVLSMSRRNSHFSSFSNPLVRPTAPQKRHSSSGQRSVLYARFLQFEHDNVSLVDIRNHGCQRSSDVSVQELHVALLAVLNEFQSRISCHAYLTTACCRQPHRIPRLCSRNALLSDRLTLLTTPESTVISTISCTTSIAFTSSNSCPPSFRFKAPNLFAPIHIRCLLQTCARLSAV